MVNGQLHDNVPDFDELPGGSDDPVLSVIDNHVDGGCWLHNGAQTRCVRKVAVKTLKQAATEPVADRRKRAQQQVARELNIDPGTVYDHCARLFDGYRDSSSRRQQNWIGMFDDVLRTVENTFDDGI